MDFLDGSDVDEDNVGDVDQDVENVLLGSDDEEAHSSNQASKFSAGAYVTRTVTVNDHHSEEEDDVLNIVLGEEEPLDFEGESSHGTEGRQRFPMKVRTSMMSNASHSMNDSGPSTSNYDAEADENFQARRYVEEDEYDDADDDSENRNTRSRFTTERNVESFSGGHAASSANSVGIPIQTVGERKVRPGAPDSRPKHWNHNGPRPNSPRFCRNQHRFPHSRPPMENPFMRPGMGQPILQFNEGLFTDFGQPLRHPRPRQPLPGRLEPRNLDHNSHHNHPQMGNNRPPMPHPNARPLFHPPEGPQNMHPPRMHPPGGGPRPPQPPHLRPDFNARPQRQRFPPNNMNMNHRNNAPPPPHMNQGPGMHFPHPQERPFPPRHHVPPFRPDTPPQGPPGMLPPHRHPNAPGFPPHQRPPPHNMPPQNFIPPQQYPPQGNQPPPPREMPHGGPQENASNQFYMAHPQAPSNFNPPRQEPGFQPDLRWGMEYDQMHNSSQWAQPPNQQPQHPSYSSAAATYVSNAMYDQTAANSMLHHGMVGHQHLPVSIQSMHHLEVPALPITKSIYIKPNSEIHEALSKGHFLPPKSELRQETSHSSKYYDDHRDQDRERSSSRRGTSPSSERRRDDDDYYDDRKSYHHDRRPRSRRYEESSSRRHRSRSRSPSPERKYSRSDRPSERDRDRESRRRDRDDPEHKESGKLLEEAKKMGLGEDYVKKLEEQRRLREKILRTKEERRKQVKTTASETDNVSPDKDTTKTVKKSITISNAVGASSSNSNKGSSDKEIEADSTVATSKGGGKPRKILRIVKDKTGKIISKKVHVVIVGKPQHEGQQNSTTTAT